MLQKIGFGNIWIHQKWPPSNNNYEIASDEEINIYFDKLFSLRNKESVVMIDTANGYGDGMCEKKIGNYLSNNKIKIDDCFISTKFGKELEDNSDFSFETIKNQFENSLNNLPKIDLLYIHMLYKSKINDCIDFFSNNEILLFIQELKKSKKIKYFGASISNPNTLEYLFNLKLLKNIEYLQIPAWFLNHENIIKILKKIYSYNIKIVVNSPIRFIKNENYEQEYLKLLNNNIISVVLSGTRNNLENTYKYYYNYTENLSQYPKCFYIELNINNYLEFYDIKTDMHIIQNIINHFLKDNLNKFKIINICNLPNFDKKEINFLYSNIKQYNKFFFKINEDEDKEYIDIIYKKNDNSTFKFSNKRQPLHTDYAYNQRDNNIIQCAFMYNIENSKFGGYTTFIDSEKLVDILKYYDLDLYERLISHEVKFNKDVKFNIDKNYKISKIITKLKNEQHIINWNYYRYSKDNNKEIIEICENFHNFLEEYIVNGCCFDLIYSWNKGDCIFWNDSSVMHGRSSFLGSRHLVKSGISI